MIFEENSAEISLENRALLTDWAKLVKSQFPPISLIELDVHVSKTEDDLIQIGRMRELAVRLALIDLNITAPEFLPSTKIWTEPPGLWGPARANDVKRVNVQVSPHC